MTRQTSTNLAEFFHCPHCFAKLTDPDPDGCNSATESGFTCYVAGFGFHCSNCFTTGRKDIIVDSAEKTAYIEVEFELLEEEGATS